MRPHLVLHRDESIGALFTNVVDDGRELAKAEIALVKAKLSERVASYKVAAIFFGAAAVLAFAAVITLLVGLVLALAPLIGPLLATLVVVGIVLVLAVVLAVIGKNSLKPPPAIRDPA